MVSTHRGCNHLLSKYQIQKLFSFYSGLSSWFNASYLKFSLLQSLSTLQPHVQGGCSAWIHIVGQKYTHHIVTYKLLSWSLRNWYFIFQVLCPVSWEISLPAWSNFFPPLHFAFTHTSNYSVGSSQFVAALLANKRTQQFDSTLDSWIPKYLISEFSDNVDWHDMNRGC